jgi:hypothetical protein
VTVNLFSALLLLTDRNYAVAMESAARLSLVQLYLANGDTYYIGLLFWSMGVVAGSLLWWKSRLIPRALATFGLASGAWCACCTFVYIIYPKFSEWVNLWWFDSPMGIFELSLSLWLIFKGLGQSGTAAARAPAAAA